MPRKLPPRSARAHAVDLAAVQSILHEAHEQEIVRLARSPDPMPSTAVLKELGVVEVQELDGSRIRLGSLWRNRAAAVVWLRHYGWLLCRDQVSQLRGIAQEAAGFGNLAIVGNGTVAHARDFDRTHSKGVLRSLVDTDRKTYQALTMTHGASTTMTAASGLSALAALSRGHVQTATKGDPYQQGGVLVVAAGGRPVFFQRSEFAGDHARLEEILLAMKQAAQL